MHSWRVVRDESGDLRLILKAFDGPVAYVVLSPEGARQIADKLTAKAVVQS